MPANVSPRLTNAMGGNAVALEFKDAISVKIPPKGESIRTNKVLIDTRDVKKIIGFEVKGNYLLYAYTSESADEIKKIAAGH